MRDFNACRVSGERRRFVQVRVLSIGTSLLLGRPFDLVVSDVVMPEETGPAMMERLRVERGVVFPSLFISGYTRPALVLKGLLGTGQEFMQKPFNPAELLGRVQLMLARQGGPR